MNWNTVVRNTLSLLLSLLLSILLLLFFIRLSEVGKEENNIPYNHSVVRVLFTLSDSDNDLAPSESISFPSCDDYYWLLRKRREQLTVKIKYCESAVNFEWFW